MAENRLSRELENRESAHQRDWMPPQTLPKPNPQPGYVFRWIRTSMMGQNDPTNTAAKFREGWTPVKAEDHPELMVQANPTGNVEIGGLLLCKVPERIMLQRAAYYQQSAEHQLDAVDNSFMRTNDARMPLFNEKRTTTSFGRGSK